jgi:hypothetical protein
MKRRVGLLFNGMFKGRYTLIGDAEHFKKADKKGLGLTIFICGILPFFRKSICARFNLALGECHSVCIPFLLLIKVYTVMLMFHVKHCGRLLKTL